MRRTKFEGRSRRIALPLLLAVPALLAASAIASAQLPDTTPAASAANIAAFGAPDLPDAPHPSAASFVPSVSAVSAPPQASPTQHDIEPGQTAPPLTPQQKVVMGVRGAFSPFAAGGWLFASGYEQVTNGPPNWGTDRGAYGQRLADSALRGGSEDVLRDSVMMPLLHEDPRYYRLGSGHKVIVRVLYAITRPLITRSDSGRDIPNFALLTGNLAGSALTNLYYPCANRSVTQTFITFGDGLAGAAVGNGVAEFLDPVLHRRFRLSR